MTPPSSIPPTIPGERRRKLKSLASEMFAPLGEEARAVAEEFATHPSALPSLLHKLSLPDQGEPEEQLVRLRAAASEGDGLSHFLMTGRREIWRHLKEVEERRRRAAGLDLERFDPDETPVGVRIPTAHASRASSSYEGPERRGGLPDRRAHGERRRAERQPDDNRRHAEDRRQRPMGRRATDRARVAAIYRDQLERIRQADDAESH